MKKLIQSILQKTLGFERYLVLFAKFKIATFKSDKNEGDFFKFVDLMNRDANVLDIGSNIGITAVHLARKVKKVYGYEPVPPNFKTLSTIINSYNFFYTFCLDLLITIRFYRFHQINNLFIGI